MNISSSVFENNQSIPAVYTCDGQNINPPLIWSDVPHNTVSLVLIMDDPDAIKPAGKIWDHWLIWNIPGATTNIEEGKNPPGVIGYNSRGNQAYGGPCPPDGAHHYFFRLYALDTWLDLPTKAKKSEIEEAMSGHILDQTELVGVYNRNKQKLPR